MPGGAPRVVLDTWTPEQASKLSLFHDWEIIHEMKTGERGERRKSSLGFLSLRDELRRALDSSSSSEEEEEVNSEMRDHTLLQRRRRQSRADRGPRKLVCSSRADTDSGLDMGNTPSPLPSELGGVRGSKDPESSYHTKQSYPSTTSLASTRYCSDLDYSTPESPGMSENDEHDSGTDSRKKVTPQWPHNLSPLDAIHMSVDLGHLKGERTDANNNADADADVKEEAFLESQEFDRKVLVIGDSGVGKSSFVRRFVARNYVRQYQPTVGVDFALKVLQWSENTKVNLQLWDIAGQERFTSMTRVYYKDADACVIMFDLSQQHTFHNAARWKEDLDNKCTLMDGSPVPCILLANKCDLSQQREVDQDSIEAFSKEHGFLCWTETSVKTGAGVDEAMKYLVDELMRRHHDIPIPENSIVNLRPEHPKSQDRCSC